MSDQKIIDISNVRALRAGDSNLTADNLRTKLEFVNAADELIHKLIGKTDFEFFLVFKKLLPEEIVEDFKFRGNSLNGAIEDLNILSKIERMIGLNATIFSPTCTEANMTGWIAVFNMAKCTFSSPEMNTEAKARAFSILLFLRLRNVLSA